MALIDVWVHVTFTDGNREEKQTWFKSIDADRVPIAGEHVQIPKTPYENGETYVIHLAVKQVMFHTEASAVSRRYSASVTLEDTSVTPEDTDASRLTVADLEAAGFGRAVPVDDVAGKTEST